MRLIVTQTQVNFANYYLIPPPSSFYLLNQQYAISPFLMPDTVYEEEIKKATDKIPPLTFPK
jgi:hypothetical protein